MRDFALLAAAGAAGALARYGVSRWALGLLGDSFPWGTLLVNLAGSLVLGLVFGVALSEEATRTTRLLLGTGFLGAFTTFSTFGVETVALLERGRLGPAALNVASNVLVGLLCAWAGLACGRALVPMR